MCFLAPTRTGTNIWIAYSAPANSPGPSQTINDPTIQTTFWASWIFQAELNLPTLLAFSTVSFLLASYISTISDSVIVKGGCHKGSIAWLLWFGKTRLHHVLQLLSGRVTLKWNFIHMLLIPSQTGKSHQSSLLPGILEPSNIRHHQKKSCLSQPVPV